MRVTSLRNLSVCTCLAALPLAGCESLPGDKSTQGAVIGGLAGVAAGAALADEDDRLLGAVIGGAVGAGGGYMIGRELEDDDPAPVDDKGGVITAEQVAKASTADIDGDGNVTLAEMVAMERAGLTDAQILQRLDATGMQFRLTDVQKQTLRDRGVSGAVIAKLDTINRRDDVIGSRNATAGR